MHRAALPLALLLACDPPPCDQRPTVDPALGSIGRDVFADHDPASCLPDPVAFEQVARPILEAKCQTCHADPPQFGAPLALTAYDALVAGEPGERPADRLAHRVAFHTMPPPTSPQLDHDELDSLVTWATCGRVHPDHAWGLSVDAPVYTHDADDTAALPSFDITAGGFPVGRETLDDYECFALDAPIDSERFIRRIQVVIDESRVLHHAVLMSDPDGTTRDLGAQFPCLNQPGRGTRFLYAWAPGTDAFAFDDGGLRIAPGDRLVVQLHYNNGAGLEDVEDDSGIRVFHGPPRGTEWRMFDTGPTGFRVPEGTSATCGVERIGEPMSFLAGMPHMHALGAELHQWVERRDGSVDEIVNLTGWNFEAQRFYRYDVALERGDRVHTRCVFDNATGAAARYGTRTMDEMCYHFVYAGAPGG